MFDCNVEGGVSSEEEVSSFTRAHEKGQSLAVCSSVLQMLQRSGSGQSEAKWPVCSQLKQITVWQALA